MTGQEFCDLVEIDYNCFVEDRTSDQNQNLEYFVNEMTKIPAVKAILRSNLHVKPFR